MKIKAAYFTLLRQCVLALFMVCCVAFSAQAKVLKVGENQAYKTIISAIVAAQNNDEIRVSKGVYKEDTIVINKSIKLIGEDWPVIDGQNKIEIVKITGNHITVSGFVFRNSGFGNIKDIAAIRLQGARHITISNNILENNYFGIYLASTRHALIKNNKVTGTYKKESASGNGIHIWKCDSISVEDNVVIGHRDGIYFEFVTNSFIRHNISTQNIRYGLHFMFSNGNTYEYNHFYKNGSGVAVMFTNNIVMRYNVFDNNWGGAAYGLLLKNISRSIITNNRFTQNTVGIYIEESDKLHVSGNLFSNNGWAVKITSSSTEDTLVNNNFFVNTFDVSTSGSSNANLFRDNYWDKYRGYDLDKNGYGDVAYRPVSLFSMIMERIPNAVMLLRSIVSDILDNVERVYPQVIPESLTDNSPRMKPFKLDIPQMLPKEKMPVKEKINQPEPEESMHEMSMIGAVVITRKLRIL
ncbi:MAG: nitrous oxide reductase family maturation protein NosD [Bacteroidia bacterium]